MPNVTVEPRDLSPLQAQQVLDFLNRATDAQQLARDIEFPDEPDIGVRLGQRLLDARAALGGSFTSILQVRAVRLIGPERFTEICIAALGFAPDRWVDLFYGGDPNAPQAETGLAVTLDARPQPAWLGQSLSLTVRVADLGGTPRAGVAVALQCDAGQLSWMFGWQRVEGRALTVLTGADGATEVELVCDPSEPLSEVQRSVLEHELAGLDIAATDPFALEASFRALGEAYLRDRSYNLRRAIDLYVRDRRDPLLAAVNPGAGRRFWPVRSALLQADVLAPGGGGRGVARAVATLEWRDWVGAFSEFFAELLATQGGLDKGFSAAVASTKEKDVVGAVLGRAQEFVAGNPGGAALWIGQNAIAGAVSRLVNGDLDNVPDTRRTALLTTLQPAAREVTPDTLGGYTLARTVERNLAGQLANLNALNLAQLAQAEELAARIDSRAQQLSALAARLDANVARFDADYARFNTDLAAFNGTRAQFRVELDGLQGEIGALRAGIGAQPIVRSGPPAAPAKTAAPRKRRKSDEA